MSELRIGSLFSGYGGLDMAVRDVIGGELAWWSDIDDGAIRIMSHHNPGVPNLGDISDVDWSSVAPIDVLTGGFPCQDISAAGKRAGIKPGTRSGLWTQMAYAISQLRPRLVVIENVRNLVNAPAHSDVEPCPLCVGEPVRDDVLRALGAVLGDLADLGFDAEWIGLPASTVGACHERWREFIVAYPAGQPWSEWNRDGGLAADKGSSGDLMLPSAVALLPTPSRSDGEGGHLSSEGHQATLSGAARELALLPTPAVNDMGAGKTVDEWDEWTAKMKAKHKNGNGHGDSLSIEAQRVAIDWGKYEAAIRRHEAAFGRPAPAPVQPSSKGTPQLSPKFTEWMMGLCEGHITDPDIWEGMTDKRGRPASEAAKRNAMLKAGGNGVIPLQSRVGLIECLRRAAA